jgi:nucleoid-associated protein YgaU
MALPTSGVNHAGGGYQASLQYRFGAPSFAGQFVGAAAAEAERLRGEINRLDDRRKILDQQTRGAEDNKATAENELRVLQKRTLEAQDEYRALLKKNAELDYRAADKAAGLGPRTKPVALPKAPRRAPPPAWPKRHRVEAGDTLRSLSGKYYGDPNLWEKIYDANPAKVDRGLPVEGAVLIIPPPKP